MSILEIYKMKKNILEISKEIEQAKKGSMIHSCLEKIAYRLYLDNKERDRETNWFEAQGYLGCWANAYIKFYNITLSTSELIQACIETGKRGNPNHPDIGYGFAEMIVETIQKPDSYIFNPI